MTPAECERLDSTAGDWVRRGFGWMEKGTRAAAIQAAECFRRSIELRAPFLVSEEPVLRYNLAGSWANFADALNRAAEEEPSRPVIEAYDRALSVIETVPENAYPAARRRRWIVKINRAGARLGFGRKARAAAIADLAAVNAELRGVAGEGWVPALLAAASAIRAEALVLQGSWAAALIVADEATDLSAGITELTAESVRIGVRARLIGCVAAGVALSAASDDGGGLSWGDFAGRAEQALRLAAQSGQDPAVRRWVAALIRVGFAGCARAPFGDVSGPGCAARIDALRRLRKAEALANASAGRGVA